MIYGTLTPQTAKTWTPDKPPRKPIGDWDYLVPMQGYVALVNFARPRPIGLPAERGLKVLDVQGEPIDMRAMPRVTRHPWLQGPDVYAKTEAEEAYTERINQALVTHEIMEVGLCQNNV